jgi:hypothetical protein
MSTMVPRVSRSGYCCFALALVLVGTGCPFGGGDDGTGGAAPPPPSGAGGTLGGLFNHDGGAAGAGGNGGGTGDAGVPDGGVVPGTVAVSWAFPGLIQTSMGTTFPTYLAHLFGKKPKHPLLLELACVKVVNGRTTPLRGRFKVDMPVYAQPSTQDFTVMPGQTISGCLDPTFDLGQLYTLRDASRGRVEALVTDLDGGAELGSAMRSFSIAAPSDIAWTAMGAVLGDMIDLAAVFVTPKDAQIDQLQRLSLEESTWRDLGGLNGYDRPPLASTDTLMPGEYFYDRLLFEATDKLTWKLTTLTGPASVDVYLFNKAQFEAYQATNDTTAEQSWKGQTAGMQATVTPGSGTHVLVIDNPSTATAPAEIGMLRTPVRFEVAADALRSVFVALQKLNTKYSNITDTFFNDWQHVRRPREVLGALSANCLDGSMLFASVLELVGMEPVIVTKTGHAYVGVRSGPGSSLIWPVETTMVGSATFDQAFDTALKEFVADEKMDPKFRVVDIKAMRARGVLPLPQ